VYEDRNTIKHSDRMLQCRIVHVCHDISFRVPSEVSLSGALKFQYKGLTSGGVIFYVWIDLPDLCDFEDTG
jgi:hypothetical protein